MNSVYTDNRWGFGKVVTQNNYKSLMAEGWVFFFHSAHTIWSLCIQPIAVMVGTVPLI